MISFNKIGSYICKKWFLYPGRGKSFDVIHSSSGSVCSVMILNELIFCRVKENGKETVEVRENGKLISRTVDGVPQLTNEESEKKRLRHK